jgi:flagellar basal body-associated protein FliL
MVSNKAIWIMVVIAVLLLGVSVFIASFSSNTNAELNKNTGESGGERGTIGLVISHPASPSGG